MIPCAKLSSLIFVERLVAIVPSDRQHLPGPCLALDEVALGKNRFIYAVPVDGGGGLSVFAERRLTRRGERGNLLPDGRNPTQGRAVEGGLLDRT